MAEPPSGSVTLLFTDVEGSTQLLQQVGDRYADILADHRRLLRSAFEAHGGYEIDTAGDAFFVAFSRAEDAIAAAGEAQRALARKSWPERGELRVRVGIHTGEPRVIDRSYVGLDVHRAARVMAAGHGGQVLISEATQKQLNDEFVLLDLGEHRLKDLLQPEHLYQLVIDGLPSEFPALKTLANRPTNLPVQPNPLIGREDELAELGALVSDPRTRLVTLTGPGGSGKTRLALQLASDVLDAFASGVFFVALAPIRDPDLVVPTVAQTLAVREVPGEDVLQTLTAYLEEKTMLLILDNFEQIVSASPSLSELLAGAPKLKLVVTSRERLRLAGEYAYTVPPLAVAEPTTDLFALAQSGAAALFLARAQALKADFTLTEENAPAIAAICARVDGLPLAIELAASRIQLLPPQMLLERLDRRLRFLTGGPRDAYEHQRTLRRTIEWSYELLSEPERTLFARLSVFAGGCRLEAADVVCDHAHDLGIDLLDGVQSLVEKSLLRQKLDPDGQPRFWMLETIREYGIERLENSGEADQLQLHQAEYVLMVAEDAALKRRNRDPAWDDQLQEEQENVRNALVWLHESERTELLLRLAASMGMFWNVHARLREGRHWLKEALAHSGGEPSHVRAQALTVAGRIAWRQGDVEEARAHVEESLGVARILEDKGATAEALWVLGVIAYISDDYERARSLCEEAADHYAELGALKDQAGVLDDLAFFALEQGDYARAQVLFQETLERMQTASDELGLGRALSGLGLVAVLQRRYGDALSILRDGLQRERDLGEMEIGIANSITAIAACLVHLGLPGEGIRLAGAADSFFEQTGAAQVERCMQEIRERTLKHARSEIDREAFLEAWNAGRAMTLDAACCYALDAADEVRT
jgi:predicted ATPase/class 3 adenylate cyclase